MPGQRSGNLDYPYVEGLRMPFGSYENGPDQALATAIRFMRM